MQPTAQAVGLSRQEEEAPKGRKNGCENCTWTRLKLDAFSIGPKSQKFTGNLTTFF